MVYWICKSSVIDTENPVQYKGQQAPKDRGTLNPEYLFHFYEGEGGLYDITFSSKEEMEKLGLEVIASDNYPHRLLLEALRLGYSIEEISESSFDIAMIDEPTRLSIYEEFKTNDERL